VSELVLQPALTVHLGEVQPGTSATLDLTQQTGVALGQILTLKDVASDQTMDLLLPLVATPGEPGTWSAGEVFLLKQMTLVPVAGVLTIPFDAANTFRVALTADITSIAFSGAPVAGVSVRVQLYFDQPQGGGFTVSGWPSHVYPAEQTTPVVDPGSKMRTSLVLDTFDGAVSVQLNLVASYGPIV
jgi:hypothetical protein